MAGELKLDETIARSSPGGVVDHSTFEALEEALDKADAPITEGGRFLTLVERVNALVARAQGPGEAVAWRPFKDAPCDAGPLLFRVTYPDGFCFYSAVEWRDGHFASSYQTNFVPGSPSVEHERTVEWVKIAATPTREG